MANRVDTSALRPRVDPHYDGPPAGAGDAPSVTERDVRAVADARLAEFFSDGVRTGIRCDFKEHHDFALCGTDAVANPVLFAKEDGDVDAVDAKDVQQRNLGDCHMMAALAAMASTPEGRAAIQGMIRETTNDKGQVSYTVILHKPEQHWLGLAQTTYTEVPVTVDGSFVQGHAEAREAGGGSYEVWPLVMEKALATFYGGYAQINRGRSPGLALEVLTGKPVDSQRLGWFSSFGPSDLTAALDAGKPVVLSTRQNVDGLDSPNLIGGHAYAVTGVVSDHGRRVLTLQNPWNRAQPDPIPIEQLDRWFSHVQIGVAR